MATFTGNMPDLLNPWVTEIFYKRLAMHESLYEQIFNMKTSTRPYEDTFAVAPLGTFVVKAEGTPISYDDPVQSERKRITHTTYGLGFRVTMEMWEDDQHNIISKMPADLGDSGANHREILAWSLPNDAFAGATFTGIPEGDGVRRALVSSAHVLLKTGEVVSNQLTPGVALSVSGIESAVTNMRLTKDQAGRQAQLAPRVIVHHTNEEFALSQILDSEKEPFTADNQINSVSRSKLGLSSLSVPWLVDTDAWFLLTDKSQHTLTWYTRKELTFDNSKDAATKDMLWDAHCRYSLTFEDWHGVVGSNP